MQDDNIPQEEQPVFPEHTDANDDGQIKFDNMRSFIVIGTNKDGTPVRALSPVMSFDDLAGYIAQLQVMLQMEIHKAAIDQYNKMRQAQPRIVRPGM